MSSGRHLVAGEDHLISGMAGRYATAAFDLARDEGAIEPVSQDLSRFAVLIEDNEDMRRLVRSPAFSSDDQTRAVTAVLAKIGIGGLAANFIRLAAQNRRLFAIADMIRAYNALAAKARGETTADVTVAQPLSGEHLDVLKAALKGSTGKNVALNVKVDPSLIGGLTVKIGSKLIDASLKTKLQSIKLAMKEVG